MRRALANAWLVMTLAAPCAAEAQSIERMVASAGDGTVQFHFAARDGVCGNGRNFYRAGESEYYNNYSNFTNGMGGDDNCIKGPVRAVLVRAGREIVRIEAHAGPLTNDPDGGKDLGTVSARDASAYFLGLAMTLEGLPARDAMQPAELADSAVVTPQLTLLVKDQARSRDIRRSAISLLARRRTEVGGVGDAAVQRTLEAVVRDRTESESIRQTALGSISGYGRAEGIPLLIGFATDADPWIAKQAFASLANSGDPRARQFLREAIKRSDLVDESRAAILRGIGNQYAGATDFKLLREIYPSVNTDQERNTIISTLGNASGSENTDWLLAIAKSPTETASRRRQAVNELARNGDPRVKEALKGLVDR